MKSNILTYVVGLFLFSAPAVAEAVEIPAGSPCYLMHSSGNHLAKTDAARAALEAPEADAPQALVFTPTSDGYYNISAPDGTFLTLSGSYNTVFADDPSTNNAQFIPVEVNSFYVKLRCRANSKYLGTDASAAGSFAYADKDGTDTRHYWYISDDPAKEPEANSIAYVINPAAERQMFDGWGVSLCWWANMCGKWSDEAIDEIVEWLVSPEYLNFSIFRYNIGGGDDPENTNCTAHHMGSGKGLRAEMEGFKDSSDGPYIWTRDEAQRKIMLKIKEKRPDAVFEAFSNSAPYYMTYSGCVAGNTSASKDNLKPEYYEEFAHYLVDVCKHYKDEYGIEFKTLDPFNEPMTSYWGANGGQEGCHFDVNSQIEFIKVLAPVLKESGLSTVISASDETSVAQAVKDLVAFRDAGILDLIGQVNTHSYTADDNSRAKLSYLCQQENIPLWMSEVGLGGTGFAGNLSLAQKLANDIRFLMPSAWLDWQYIEENNDQWCLVQARSFASGKYSRVKNFYVRSHFSRFIKEGYTILTTLNAQTLAARSPEGDELVLVAFNTGAADVVHNVDLSMYEAVGADIKAYITDADRDMASMDCSVADGKLSFRLPAECIATIVIPVTAPASSDNTLREGENYIIAPRAAAGVALTAEAGALLVRNNSIGRSQVWNIAKQGDGYRFTTLNGDIVTEIEDQYALTTAKQSADRQAFLIDNIDGVHYKIYTDADKAFDLSGEKTADGTTVGVWIYSDTDAPAHRQWLFMAVPEEAVSAIKNVAADAQNSAAPVTVCSPAAGALKVERVSECAGRLAVYAPSGACVYSREMTSDSVEIPLASGCYIVTFVADGVPFATTVAVR